MAIFPSREQRVWLDGCLGFESRMTQSRGLAVSVFLRLGRGVEGASKATLSVLVLPADHSPASYIKIIHDFGNQQRIVTIWCNCRSADVCDRNANQCYYLVRTIVWPLSRQHERPSPLMARCQRQEQFQRIDRRIFRYAEFGRRAPTLRYVTRSMH
jgi:hypothetical protein